MPYVMVPVPEEHVTDVMRAILSIVTRAALDDWTAEDFEQLYREADEPNRAVLSVVARATLTNRRLTDLEAAQTIEIGVRELNEIIREVNDGARELNHPAIVSATSVPMLLANGRTQEQRLMSMPLELAELVKKAEKAEVAGAPAERAGGDG